jgi:ubiquinone/menaquinone biosynthesis C-methylase UbiE
MNKSLDAIRDDFDRIAMLSDQHGGASVIHHNYVLRHLPPRCENALEIGCGTGEFTRLLSARAERVCAIDLSTQMIRLAREQSAAYSNIEYVTGDALQLSLPAESYDCIVSLATLHHLPLKQAVLKMKAALSPEGVLIIHDLVADEGIIDMVKSALAFPVNMLNRFRETGRLRAPREVREAWRAHGEGEVYLTLSEVKEMCRQYLPGAKVRRNLLWRYTVVWRKPAAA